MNDESNVATELAELRRELAELRARIDDPPLPSRRALFTKVGALGAAAVTGGWLAQAEPAAAAPTTFMIETVNSAVDSTELRYTGAGPWKTLLFVQDGLWGAQPVPDRSNVMTVWSGNWALNAILAVSNAGSGHAIEARGESVTATGLLVSGRRAAIRFLDKADVLPPPDTFVAHSRGEVQYDKDGTLWYCIESTSAAAPPGQWRKLSGAGTAGAFHVLASPVRAYSSRDSGAAKLAPAEERTINLSAASVPEGATAVLVNLTCTQTDGPGGYIAMLSSTATWQSTSNVNWVGAGVDIANTAVSAVGPGSAVKLRGGGAATHVLVDVFGYWR